MPLGFISRPFTVLKKDPQDDRLVEDPRVLVSLQYLLSPNLRHSLSISQGQDFLATLPFHGMYCPVPHQRIFLGMADLSDWTRVSSGNTLKLTLSLFILRAEV